MGGTRAPSSDRKRNPALIRPLLLVNWTRQLSCQVINSLRKFSALSQASLNTAIWIDKQSPVCTKCLLDSFVSQQPLPLAGQYTCTSEPPPPSPFIPTLLLPLPSIPGVALTPLPSPLPPFLPCSVLTSLTFTHWSLCHFLNNDPGAGGTTACLYFITVRPLCRRPGSLGGVWGAKAQIE